MRARPTKFSKSGSVENRRRSNSQNLSRLCVWHCVSLVAWLFLGAGSFSLKAATLPAGFTESQWGSAMPSAATAMAFAPDGRLFVCLQSGQVRVINKDGVLLANPFVTLSVDSNGERGLLGVAFDPNFASNHYVYLYYTVPGSPAHNRISRFTANGNVAAANSEFVLVDLDNLSNATNHNGGAIHFGPDGKLYAGVGDNANGTNAQSLSNRLGKILRINSNGTIPPDNPRAFPGIVGSTSGANRAIWAVGLRNPFTFAFQPGTARLFINDVGQSTWEEINNGVAGSNYGWPAAEGPASPPNPNFRDPIFYYGHGSSSTTGCAIVGGAFYNPSVLQFPSSFLGKYFFADLCSGWIRVLDPINNTASGFASDISSPVDLHVGPDGALYYLTRGGVFRIQTTGPPVVTTNPATFIASFSATLNGLLYPHGLTTSVYFQYGLTTSYGSTTHMQIQNGNTLRPVSANITGLLANRTYHFRIVATNSDGTRFGSDMTFTTLTATGPPVVTSNPATFIANFSATLNGSLDPHGFTTTVHFQYGTTTSYGLTTAPQSQGGNTYRNVGANISSLSANTVYHFRIVATNSGGTRFGSDRTFTTLTATGFPVVITNPATNVATSSATLNGSLNPHGLTTSVYFQYGTTTSYGHTTPMQSQTGNTYRNITANIGGLARNTTYHFRIVATNSVGTRYGNDRTFTTQ